MNQAPLQIENTICQPILHMAFELSLKKWKIAFGDGSKKRVVTIDAQDLNRLVGEIGKAKEKFGMTENTQVVSCYEAGREGFWLHRLLASLNIGNVVLDSASIEVNRRSRRAKNDHIDAVKMLHILVRYHGGEKKVCSVAKVPTPEEEDDRRLHRELERLKKERTSHRNRIRGLMFTHGCVVEPSVDLAEAIEKFQIWDGSLFPENLKCEIQRECERLRLVENHIRVLEKLRRERLKQADTERLRQIAQLMNLRAIGMTSAWIFVMEFFGWRNFKNRREVGAAAGLTPTPYDSGDSRREQGISKAGNKRIRSLAVEIAWLWLRYQPGSALSLWYNQRFAAGGKRMRRIGIVAMARRLLIALWRYLKDGVLPEGAQLKPV